LRGRFVGACPLPHGDQFQWMIRLAPGETPPPDEEQISRCIRARTGNKRLSIANITWKSVFRPNIRLAERYRNGRIFLAGDAAHAHTPAGAQGLNTGVQDSYNLGWKLAQVLAGAPSELLDTYEVERQPVAAAVLGLSTKKYSGLGKLDPSSIKRGKDEQQLGLSYRGGPIAPSTVEKTATLHVGDRAPDATVQDSNGTPLRLFDLYRGPHFTALAFGSRAAQELSLLAWPHRGAALRCAAIDNSDAAIADVRNLRDSSGNLRKTYGIIGDALLIIRPDGYIASIATHDILATTTTAITALAPPVGDLTTERSLR
jgi:hypothetical protein